MADNRPLNTVFASSDYHSLAAAINKVYCDRHGYDFLYYRPYLDDPATISLHNCQNPHTNAPRHCSWSKILASLLALKKTEYDYYVYIDSDCIFRNMDITLEDTIATAPTSDLIFMNNRPWNHNKLCAGFYILKNTDKSRQFLVDCYMYNCPDFDINHHWEQEAFRRVIAGGKYNSALIDTIWFDESPGQQLRHISSHTRHLRIPYFKEFINNNNLNYSEIISSIISISFPTSDLRVFF
jgi:hypothetical protein